jgi:hypothetical protein
MVHPDYLRVHPHIVLARNAYANKSKWSPFMEISRYCIATLLQVTIGTQASTP